MAVAEGMVRALVREWLDDLDDFAIAETRKRFTEDDYASFGPSLRARIFG